MHRLCLKALARAEAETPLRGYGASGDDVAETAEAKPGEQSIELFLILRQSDVMPESRNPRTGWNSRLLGVYLPRMDIEHKGLPLAAINAAKTIIRPEQREEPKIPAAADW